MHRSALVVASLGLLVSVVSALAGCRSGSTGDDDLTGGDAAPPTLQRIQDVQSDAMDPATPVALKGVIVTAIDKYGAKTGDFWVQDPGGGEYSGVHVFGAPIDQVAALTLGDIVDIVGAEKDEFALASDLSGRTLTELKPVSGGAMIVTKTGTGTVPAPHVVDALAIGMLGMGAAQDAEWEKWEGVLITVTNVAQTGSVRNIGSGMTADPTFKKFPITGNVQVETSLAAFPAALTTGTCYASITGVGDYFFDYLVFPRTTDEIVTGGTSCPAPEATQLACTDSLDNDGNGFSDCSDNNCIVPVASCRATTTIAALRSSMPMGGIELAGAFVTRISKNKKNMWIQSDAVAAPNAGIYVYGTGAELAFAVGSRVNVIGVGEEFNDSTGTDTLSEVKALDVTAASGTGSLVAVTGQTAASLVAATTGEPYEGVLVTLTQVKVNVIGNPASGGNYGVGQLQQGSTTFRTDDDIFLLPSAVGTCFSSITGVWTYFPYDNTYGFLPVAAGTAGTGC